MAALRRSRTALDPWLSAALPPKRFGRAHLSGGGVTQGSRTALGRRRVLNIGQVKLCQQKRRCYRPQPSSPWRAYRRLFRSKLYRARAHASEGPGRQ